MNSDLQPLVSIIVPHFNRIKFLNATVESVLKQSYLNWELLIIDDGSDNAAVEALNKFNLNNKILIIIRTALPKGPSHCRNIGAENSKGKYLLFLDSDDLLAPHCVSQRVKMMEDNPDVSVGIFKMAIFTDAENLNNDKIYNKNLNPDKWIEAFIENNNPWNVTCPLWRKAAFEKVGGFENAFLFMEDPEIHLRLLVRMRKEVKCFNHLPVDSHYRINNIDSTKDQFFYNSILYRIKFYNKLISDAEYRSFWPKYNSSYSRGIILLVKNFLFSRASVYPHLVQYFKQLILQTGGLNKKEKFKLSCALFIAKNNSALVRILHLKGMAFKLLLRS